MDKVLWEQTCDGKCVNLVKGQLRIKQTKGLLRAFLRVLAIQKMTDTNCISATFENEYGTFDPEAFFLFDMYDEALFIGAYIHRYGDTEDREKLPDLCIRKAVWHQEADYESFNRATDRSRYLREAQIQSRILFYHSSKSKFRPLLNETQSLFNRGIKLVSVDRPDSRWRKILCEVEEGCRAYRLSYTPTVLMDKEFEDIGQRWIDAGVSLDAEQGVVPDDGCRISYESSIWDRLEMFTG